MTLGAVILEFALAFLLWARAARPAMMALGAALHLGISVMVNIPLFGRSDDGVLPLLPHIFGVGRSRPHTHFPETASEAIQLPAASGTSRFRARVDNRSSRHDRRAGHCIQTRHGGVIR